MLYTVRHYIDYGDKIKSKPKKEFDTAKEAIEYANSLELDTDTDRIAVFEGCGDAFDEEIYTIDATGEITDRRKRFVNVTKIEELKALESTEMVDHINKSILRKYDNYDANLYLRMAGKQYNEENKATTLDPFNPNGEYVYIENDVIDYIENALGRHRTIAIKGTGVEDSFWVYSCTDTTNHIWTATKWSRELVD